MKSCSTVSDSLVVTYPFHPLVGQRLNILDKRRLVSGMLYTCESGYLSTTTLPERWTDRAPEPAERPLTWETLTKLAETITDMKQGSILKEGEK